MKPRDPFDRGYQSQGVNDLIVTINHVAGKVEGHEAFQGPVSEYVYLSPRLREIASKLEAAREKGDQAEVNSLMALGVKALDFNADHLASVAVYRNNPNILLNSGYGFKPESTAKPKLNLLDLVPELLLKHLEGVSGGIVVVAKRAKNTASVELQMTETPKNEESWRGIGEGTFNKSRTEVRGIEPTKRIWVRGRYHEDGGVGHWSAPVSIIVLGD